MSLHWPVFVIWVWRSICNSAVNEQYVDSIAGNCFYQLRQFRSVRRTFDGCVHEFVGSRVDSVAWTRFCVALQHYVIRLLQSVHVAMRIISRVRLCQHITLTLRDTLHWLTASCSTHPLHNRHNDGTCPAYFRDVCRPVAFVHARARLCSAHHSDLVKHRTNPKRYGHRSFRISAPAFWNNVPSHRRTENIICEQFAPQMKTYLFARAYSIEAPLWVSACLRDIGSVLVD